MISADFPVFVELFLDFWSRGERWEFKNNFSLTSVLTWISTVYWTIDFVRTFFLGYHDKGMLVMTRKEAALHRAQAAQQMLMGMGGEMQ